MRFLARYRKIINTLVVIICVILFVYFAYKTINMKDNNIEPSVYPGTAMGTTVKKTIYADSVSICDETNGLIDVALTELENQISVRVQNSEIYKLNSNYVVGGVNQVSDDLLSYLKVCRQICDDTNGAFSPCIRPLIALWGIEEGFDVIPEAAAIEEALQCSNPDYFEVVENGVIFTDVNMGIDLGAAGKGIACDVVKEQLMQTDIQGAVISVGGSILVYGDKGNGHGWNIAIQDPRGATGDVLGVIYLDGEAMISTSGDYEKYFEIDGKRYHHIFDPNTGYPADNGLISVTVVCDNGMLSDVLSTACFVMGLEDGMEYAKTKGVEAIFVTDEKKVYVTDGLKKTFQLRADAYTLEK